MKAVVTRSTTCGTHSRRPWTTHPSAPPSPAPSSPAEPSGESSSAAAGKVSRKSPPTRRGVRAALCNNLFTARLSRSHNDANVLAMGGRIVARALADEILRLWLATPFEGGRHERRVDGNRGDRTRGAGEQMSDPEAALAATDPRDCRGSSAEVERQNTTIQLIASENFTSLAARRAGLGADEQVLGGISGEAVLRQAYRGRRRGARPRWCLRLFGADHANVQPLVGVSANMAAYMALLDPGDKVMGMGHQPGRPPDAR